MWLNLKITKHLGWKRPLELNWSNPCEAGTPRSRRPTYIQAAFRDELFLEFLGGESRKPVSRCLYTIKSQKVFPNIQIEPPAL